MINFFRKIRKQLADANKPFKYMRYAIGEIVLVVIGILIALQINNLNERNKTSAFELELLYSFKNGLQKDLSDIDVNVGFHKNGLIAMDSLLIYLQTNKTIHEDSIAHLFSEMMLPTFFQYSTSAFETLKSKGITTIANEGLRNNIISVYDSQYNFFLKNQAIHVNEIERGITEIFPMRFEDSYYYDLESVNFAGSLRPLNFEALKTDQEFLYYIKSLKNRTTILIDFNYENLRQKVSTLLAEIEVEISKNETH